MATIAARRITSPPAPVAGGFDRADIKAINAKLSDTPMSVLGMDSAVDVARKMVAGLEALH